MAGNSWLAKSQINFAAKLSHPALKAIAPLEGFTHLYRQFAVRGSIPSHTSCMKLLQGALPGLKPVRTSPL